MNKKRGKSKITNVLGPVESLESYVRADWWMEIFNANYLRTDGDVIDDNEITENEADTFLAILNLPKTGFILDLCCGQGRHSLEIAKRGYSNVYGLDRSHYLITKARKQNRTLNLNVNFKEGDARELPYPSDMFDCVIIPGNSFGYFESNEDDKKVLMEVFRILKPEGRILLDISDGSYLRLNFVPRSWEWIDQNYFVCRERCLSSDGLRLVTREVITHVKKGVIADQFYAERLYSREDISRMLKDCSYSNICFEDPLVSKSRRNQDLGMMAMRFVVTASVEKEWTPKVKKDKRKKSVLVVLGDPRLSDDVKPSCIFDNDDYITINRMKKALSEIKGYNFTYFDNHSDLLSYLLKNKGRIDFVFNLCDEGYFNDPLKELHLPAILEILNIPYSGGNPRCLSYCYDKSLVRGISKELDIPVPEAFLIKPGDSSFIEFPIHFPVIVKPNTGDSSFGITKESVCNDINQLQEAIAKVRNVSDNSGILVEEFLAGKDISVGIIGNPPDSYEVLPVIEEDYSGLPGFLPKICGYEAKWDSDSPYACIKSIPAELSEDVHRFLVASCLTLFSRLGCRDYARFDWRLDKNGTPRLLEVNPNPGWCWDGHLAKMAEFAGITYPQMLEMIITAADERLSSS
ncbi:MAG: methyltransferase domain-containing protein [Methanomicrobium sp.]|nr:methyltransferase domain-containing protein [Methanomicrobium sp.]